MKKTGSKKSRDTVPLTPFPLVTHSYTDILPKQCFPFLFQLRSADTNKAVLLNFDNFPRRHAFAKVFLWEKSNHDYELYKYYVGMETSSQDFLSFRGRDLSNFNVLYLKTLIRWPIYMLDFCTTILVYLENLIPILA